MANELQTIEKKLTQLKTSKEKEENKSKEFIDKLTNKYNDEAKKLETAYKEKVADNRKELQGKLNILNPEIEFYEKQKSQYIKLAEQQAAIFKGVQERMSNKPEEKIEE